MQTYRNTKDAHTTSWSLRPGMVCSSQGASFGQPIAEGADLNLEARR